MANLSGNATRVGHKGLFCLSYLDAFAYLLSPGIVGARSPNYPKMKNRVQNFEKAANSFFVSVPPEYVNSFDDGAEPNLSQSDLFRLSIADEALERVADDLIRCADHEITSAGFATPSKQEVEAAEKERHRIGQRFRHVVPAEGCRGIADILNSAWDAQRDKNLWADMPHVKNDRERILKELVLKNIEVFEIEQIVGVHDDPAV